MATMLETPSRIWRRIEAIENEDMPSLPSLPGFENSEDVAEESSNDRSQEDFNVDQYDEDFESMASPLQSTPTSTLHTMRGALPSSTSSTARFAHSIASRSNRSTNLTSTSSRRLSSQRNVHNSFEAPSLPHIVPNLTGPQFAEETGEDEEDMEEQSKSSVPEVYLPPAEDEDEFDRELSLTDALESLSRSNSPGPRVSREATPKKLHEYSFSLKSEPKASPFEKYRNVALRNRPTNPRTRTPSLSRTSSSQTTSPTHSTPQSDRSVALPLSRGISPRSTSAAANIPLPRSNSGSPAIIVHRPEEDPTEESIEAPDFGNDSHGTEARSMDITDIHVSPPRLDGDNHEFTEDAQSEAETQQNYEEHHEFSHGDREPTFSSEGEEATPYAPNLNARNASTFSSPSQSVAFTPTPAFPRPRARFDLPAPPSDLMATPATREEEEQEREKPLDDLMTPHTRRRSFLLDVINSTARPRMRFPTPHARRFGTPALISSEDASSNSRESSSGVSLQAAFAGVTPRPRIAPGRRVSHPLSQAISANSPEGSESNPSSGGSAVVGRTPSTGTVPPARWHTPGARLSSHEGISFISTASSHDLTTHQRANTSFDPAMGFGAGAPGHGVGRFNAGKLNTYLHGLNRRLQEENELLLERLRKMDEERKTDPSNTTGVAVAADSSRRVSTASRRASAVGTLENVDEGWLEEKAELEDMVEAFKIEVNNCMAEKGEVEQALAREQLERESDRESWKARMAEVEHGVSEIISGLEKKLEAAEKQAKENEEDAEHHVKEMERFLAEVQDERDIALERVEKAEKLLENGKDLGSALKEANDRAGQVMSDLRNANAQIKDLEDEVMRSDARIDELEKHVQEDKETIASLEEELASRSDTLAEEQVKLKELETEIQQLDEELRATKDYVSELEGDATNAFERIDQLEQELASAQGTIQVMATSEKQTAQDLKALQNETIQAQETARQMEEALEEAEQKMMEDEAALAELRSKVSSLERERLREASRDISRVTTENGPSEEEYQALEKALDEADKEIARLNALLNQSPARKAMDKAKDTKIEMLEREKEELLERNRALRMTFNEMATPSRVVNASGISPIHRQVLSMSIRAPKTPGAPLKDLSWLHSTMNDPSVSPLLSEINRLQHELDRANESIDDKLDKLEDAGMGVVGLTKKLEDARSRIASLEDEIARLTRKEERRARRLNRVRCQKCNVKVDLGYLTQADESSMEISRDVLPSEPPTPPTRTSEALKANLQAVNEHLEDLRHQWETEKHKLLGEKAALENAANHLNGQIRSTQEEARKTRENNKATERLRANFENELDKAKRTISVLETELASERSKLRNLVTEQERTQREKKQIMTDLQRTESDMNDVKQQLLKFKKENNELERELRENATVEQKARLLETRVAENAETIEQLRQERSLLAADHKKLQRRFAEASEVADKLRNEYVAHSTSHDQHRHELDLHRLEIEDLRQALDERADDLHRVEKEKKQLATENTDVARTVAALEADLRRVRRDAEAFGRDLKLLRNEKEKLEVQNKDELAKTDRAKKQAQTQIRLLTEQLEAQKDKTVKALEQIKSHVCESAGVVDDVVISKMKLQHNKECKGLMVQIRYLKAKFTRESCFRTDLTYQKQYLLVLLSQFEKSERTILASIARIGFAVAPSPYPKKRPHSLKSVVLLVVFLSRINRSTVAWRRESASKQAIAAALEDVRRRRVTGTA